MFLLSFANISVLAGEDTDTVSTCAELKASLAKPYVTTIIVSNRITLETGVYNGGAGL